MHAASTPGTPTLSAHLFAMVGRHGSPEERQLLAPYREAISRFLDHPDIQFRSRRTILDIGLENSLVLKFNLMSSEYSSPWAMIDHLAGWEPRLQDISEVVLRHQLRCHVGFKIARSGIEYELYPYETPAKLLATEVFATQAASDTGLPLPPYCYGYTSRGALSAYASLNDVPASELEEVLGTGLPSAGLRTKALFHSRYQANGKWEPDKAGIEFLPFPSHMLNAALSRLHLNFSYLLHRGGRRPYGVIGVKGAREVLYTTLATYPAGTNPASAL